MGSQGVDAVDLEVSQGTPTRSPTYGWRALPALEDRGFGEDILGMVPDAVLRMAEAAGVDPRVVAAMVRSVKVRARKP